MRAYERLEKEWARWNDLDPAGMVVCASGTAALHLALEALRPPSGNEVVVPDFTMVACARAVVLAGLTPVFVDCGDDLLMDMTSLTELPSSDTRVYMAVHVYGRRCDMDTLIDISDREGCRVVEDLAEAHGVKPHNGTAAACWSFYRNKVVAGEEGGAVWFKDAEHARLARRLRTLGFTDAHDFTHIPRGHNYRMSDAHAELVSNSLRQFDASIESRRLQEMLYDASCPPEWRMLPRRTPWVYDFRVPGMSIEQQNRVVAALQGSGVDARHGFKPMHMQQEFADCGRVGGNSAETLSREIVYLPLYSRKYSVAHLDAFRMAESASS